MAAPDGIVWGSEVNGKGKIGIYTEKTSTNTQTTVSIQVWFWSKYGLTDSSNTLYFDTNATSATTSKGAVSINHTVSSGSGWSTSNQTKLGTYSYTYNRTTSNVGVYCAAKFANIDYVGGTMTVSSGYTIPALTTYNVTYVANGGSGTPVSQVKFYGMNITLSTVKPTRTGYTFLGWSTSSTATTATYASGATFSANANTTLYAVWKAVTYAITYNANGGTAATVTEYKTHDVSYKIRESEPLRTDYNFLGWGTSATTTTVSYLPGQTYSANAPLNLYAVWKLDYTKPRVTDFMAKRCDSTGSTFDKNTSTATYFVASFDWATDKTVSSIKVEWKASTATSWLSSTISASGTSGSVKTNALGSGAISVDSTYDIRVTVSDASGSTSVTRTLHGGRYEIDFLYGGGGVAIGKPAEKEGFDIAYPTYIDGIQVTGHSLRAYNHDTISGASNDTTAKWAATRNSIHYYATADSITDQPSTYGFLLNLVNNSTNYPNVRQLWFAQPSGSLAHRGANSSGWSGTWRTILDGTNYTDYCVPKTGGTFSGYTTSSYAINTFGYFRLHNDYIGIFKTYTDANANTTANRKGWIGFNSSNNFSVVNGSGGTNTTNIAWTVSSDERLKKQIDDIPLAFVDIWNELQPKMFKWNSINSSNDKIHFGLIAQDVIDVFEKHGLNHEEYGFVNSFTLPDDETEYFGIAYDEYHMLTSMVLKNTVSELEAQKKEIDSLKEQINEIKALLS